MTPPPADRHASVRRFWLMLVTVAVIAVQIVFLQSADAGQSKLTATTHGPYCALTLSGTNYKQGQHVPSLAEQCKRRQSVVHTNATVPSGYYLPNGSETLSTFRAGYFQAVVLDNNANVVARVDHSLGEVITSRTTWTLEIRNVWIFGAAYSARGSLDCGVNISGSSDPTCDTWSSNSGARGIQLPNLDALGYDQKTYYAPGWNFGSRSGVKYPLMNDQILWPSLGNAHNIDDHGDWGSYWRGWDTCETANSSSMCASTGTGH